MLSLTLIYANRQQKQDIKRFTVHYQRKLYIVRVEKAIAFCIHYQKHKIWKAIPFVFVPGQNPLSPLRTIFLLLAKFSHLMELEEGSFSTLIYQSNQFLSLALFRVVNFLVSFPFSFTKRILIIRNIEKENYFETVVLAHKEWTPFFISSSPKKKLRRFLCHFSEEVQKDG